MSQCAKLFQEKATRDVSAGTLLVPSSLHACMVLGGLQRMEKQEGKLRDCGLFLQPMVTYSSR